MQEKRLYIKNIKKLKDSSLIIGKIRHCIIKIEQTDDEYAIQIEQSDLKRDKFISNKIRTFYLIRKYVSGFWFLHYPPTDETKMLSAEDLQNEHLVANYILKWAYVISINE